MKRLRAEQIIIPDQLFCVKMICLHACRLWESAYADQLMPCISPPGLIQTLMLMMTALREAWSNGEKSRDKFQIWRLYLHAFYRHIHIFAFAQILLSPRFYKAVGVILTVWYTLYPCWENDDATYNGFWAVKYVDQFKLNLNTYSNTIHFQRVNFPNLLITEIILVICNPLIYCI